ncbi:MAG: hypothetical protein JWM10_5284 [Myxococcaceae bacterium]|nr:hypothetical protein [Myxococcaceae bacterium]
MAVRRGHCEACGRRGPVIDVHYRQNTGMLVMRKYLAVTGTLCRGCSFAVFRKLTLHNLLFGWWGYISLVVTPFLIAANVHHAIRTLRVPTAEGSALAALDDQREYAVNLLRTKDDETVVGVLQRETGAPREAVAAWVARVRAEMVAPASR